MKYPIIFSILIFNISMVFGQSQVIPLWPDGVPNAIDSKMEEKVVITETKRVSMVTDPTIEVFLPDPAKRTGQSVLICPGGGYAILAYDKEGTKLARLLSENGIAGVVLKYRLPEDESNEIPHKSPLMDAKRGMELIRENADTWGLDKDKVGVMGFSAGGHLASTLGTHSDEANKPNFMILIYPVVTMKKDYTHNGSRVNLLGQNPTADLVAQYSNELQVKDNTPPTFIVHSQDDQAVPVENTLQLYTAMKSKDIPVEMHLYPYGGHGYGMAGGRGRLSEWPNELLRWVLELE